MRRGVWPLAILPLTVGVAFADTPGRSLLPMPRPADLVASAAPTILPLPRPQGLNTPADLVTTASSAILPPPGPPGLQGIAVPANPVLVAAPVAMASKPTVSLKGSVCQNPNIKGLALKPIASRIAGCNVAAPVQVSVIDGVRLILAAIINCDEASAMASWINAGLQPAFGNLVTGLVIADSYSCRPRNNVRGAQISEHGAGNAIDISGFELKTGRVMMVAANYGSQIRTAQKAACGTFHTTLGPGSDGYHESHIHLDVATYRGSPYCR